jgi:hypothetical protein
MDVLDIWANRSHGPAFSYEGKRPYKNESQMGDVDI